MDRPQTKGPYINMRKIYYCVLFFSIPAQATNELILANNIINLPADFKNYFFESEVSVRFYLDDEVLFDGNALISEAGKVTLTSFTTEYHSGASTNQVYKWEKILRKGIHLGNCQDDCPEGLMKSNYDLSTSSVKLFTDGYEKARVKSRYISAPDDAPAGFIMNNDLVAAGGTKNRQGNWGLNSTSISSIAGWTQKSSFQLAGFSDPTLSNEARLYEAYTQKEFKGNFLRLGYFTPDIESGNVQTGGYGSSTIIGAMWGTSDALLESNDIISLYPIYITGQNQSVAEIYRNNILIYTQQLQAGIQALDTRRLPSGIYDISVDIIDSNGKKIGTQTAQVYKPRLWATGEDRWRYNIWSGYLQPLASGNRYDYATGRISGGALDVLLHPRVLVGAAVAANKNKKQYSIRTEVTVTDNDSIFGQYRYHTGSESTSVTDIRYFRSFKEGNLNLSWRHTDFSSSSNRGYDVIRYSSNQYSGSLTQRLPFQSQLTLGAQYFDSHYQKGTGADISLSTNGKIAGRDVTFRVSGYNTPGYKGASRNTGIELGVTLSLAPEGRNDSVSANLGMQDNKTYSGISYNWRPQGYSPLSYASATISANQYGPTISGNGGIDADLVNGDFYIQQSSRDGGVYGGINMRNTVVSGKGYVATSKQPDSMPSALIIDVETDSDNSRIDVDGAENTTVLQSGRNILSVEALSHNLLQFTGHGSAGLRVYPDNYTSRMNYGSVDYLKLRAVRTRTLVSRLFDEQGKLLRNRTVVSDVSSGQINSDGVLTLDIKSGEKDIQVNRLETNPGLHCRIPETSSERDSDVLFINKISCNREEANE